MKKSSVNLLRERQKEPTSWEKLYIWVTTTCRVIVIVIEVLVLGAFGWRFFLDRKLKDLEADIKTKNQVLINSRKDEAEIRDLQSKLVSYDTLWKASSDKAPLMNEVRSLIPSGISKESLSIGGGKVTISGEGSVGDVNNLEDNINKSNIVKNKIVSNYETIKSTSGQDTDLRRFSFVMDIAIKEDRDPIIVE